MNNRIKHNRNQLPSKRPKFKENNPDEIYSIEKNSKKPIFKTVSKKELAVIKKRIREHAEAEHKKERIIYIIFFVLGLIAIILIPLLFI